MKWKYLWLFVFFLLLIGLLIPSYRYVSSVDWSQQHSAKVKALPILSSTDDSGLFRLPVGEFEFYIRVAGLQNEGPAIILLHGFPESAIMWTDLLDRAAEEGYRVVAFDQRGYSPGARPKGVDNYHIDKLTQDVLDVADQLTLDSFHLVGHDWGAVVSWNVAMNHADRLHTLSALSIPHIGVFFNAVQHHPEQQQRSGYIKRLQMPVLPEYKFVANEQLFYRQMMGNNRPEFLAEYLGIFAEHGAATATLNWYRALDVNEVGGDENFAKPITCPTLFIWGNEDGVIAPAIIPEQEALIVGSYKEVELDTGHGLIQTKPDEVIGELLEHFNRSESK